MNKQQAMTTIHFMRPMDFPLPARIWEKGQNGWYSRPWTAPALQWAQSTHFKKMSMVVPAHGAEATRARLHDSFTLAKVSPGCAATKSGPSRRVPNPGHETCRCRLAYIDLREKAKD